MGSDKGLLEINGISFVEHCIRTLAPLTSSLYIITGNKAYNSFGVPCFEDLYRDCGPLGGIYTGLHYSETDHNFVFSCDMPLVSTKAFERLKEQHQEKHQVTTYASDQCMIPTVGLYEKNLISVFKTLIERKQLSLIAAVTSVPYGKIAVPSAEVYSFRNINTRNDYKEILA